jgi:UPF0716 protein FxsA
MALFLVLLFIVLPIAELYVIIQVGQAIGVLNTIGLLILDSLIGAALWRSQGRAVWSRFNAALAEGRVPHKEVLDGVMVIFGGALLLTPGFLTDVLGLVLLLPPTRAVFRGLLIRSFTRRIALGRRVVYWSAGAAGARRQSGSRPGDIEGSGFEVDDESPRLGP